MKYLKALLLGLVQGLTEFLPVSSSGHLMLLEELGVGNKSLYFSLMLHLATLFSICITFRKQIWQIIKKPLQKQMRFILISTIPSGIIALIIRLFIEDVGVRLLPFGFMVTAILLALSSLKWKGGKELDNFSSVIVGIAQGVATIGGVSRSGSVISIQMVLGIEKEKASEFTFLLSIPIIIASVLVEAFAFKGYEKVEMMPLLLAMLVAFLSGLFAIKLFRGVIQKGAFLPFAIYTFLLSIASFFIIY